MAALVQFSPAGKDGFPCNPGTPRAMSWETLGLGPAPPTTCVLVQQGAMTPPSPATPRSLITSSVLSERPASCSNGHDSKSPALNISAADALRCKRRIDFAARAVSSTTVRHHGVHKPQTPSVVRRNERERNRVRLVNMGFTTLRQHVPAGRDNRKMSKVETLRSAAEYIKQLQQLLRDTDNQNNLTLDTFALQNCGGHDMSLQHLAAACDIQQQEQLSPGGSLGESEHTPSPSGYSSSAEESHTASSGPRSPDPSLTDLTTWLQ